MTVNIPDLLPREEFQSIRDDVADSRGDFIAAIERIAREGKHLSEGVVLETDKKEMEDALGRLLLLCPMLDDSLESFRAEIEEARGKAREIYGSVFEDLEGPRPQWLAAQKQQRAAVLRARVDRLEDPDRREKLLAKYKVRDDA
jgi:hypothetical protein